MPMITKKERRKLKSISEIGGERGPGRAATDEKRKLATRDKLHSVFSVLVEFSRRVLVGFFALKSILCNRKTKH